MTASDEERELRQRFIDLKRHDQRRAPDFEKMGPAPARALAVAEHRPCGLARCRGDGRDVVRREDGAHGSVIARGRGSRGGVCSGARLGARGGAGRGRDRLVQSCAARFPPRRSGQGSALGQGLRPRFEPAPGMVTTMKTLPRVLCLALLGGTLAACAKREPLPGDSVSSDGAIALSPPRLSTAPPEAREAREGLGPNRIAALPAGARDRDHQGELAITGEQKSAILAETERGQSTMLRLQWELSAEKEKLVKLLDAERADEARVQEAAARVIDRETKIKASHLGMLVRVKNLLTPDQQAKLRAVQSGARPSVAPDASTAAPSGSARSPNADTGQ